MKETALYIHIPFCDHKCIYCDFYSIITTDNINNYLTALRKEIDRSVQVFSEDREIISVFFGGGTPSLMTPAYISEILNSVSKGFHLSDSAEITLETNPGTVERKKLAGFLEAGINRISIGIQSFDEMDLKFMTRIHDPDTAVQTVTAASEIGFNNISVDLIFNLPGQTRDKWLINLEKAAALPITHISPYSLILEPGTILNKMVLDGKVSMQDSDYDADLYETTINYLSDKGFRQYEVSNFAREGFECVHNLAYWRYKDYLGFGTSAHSFIGGKRWKNYSSLKFYLDATNNKGSSVASEEILSVEEQIEEYVMLALRSRGLDKNEMKKKFGPGWLDKNREMINLLLQNGYITEDDFQIKFTRRGYAVCDEILTKFED